MDSTPKTLTLFGCLVLASLSLVSAAAAAAALGILFQVFKRFAGL